MAAKRERLFLRKALRGISTMYGEGEVEADFMPLELPAQSQ